MLFSLIFQYFDINVWGGGWGAETNFARGIYWGDFLGVGPPITTFLASGGKPPPFPVRKTLWMPDSLTIGG